MSPAASAPAEAMAPELPAPDDYARWAHEIQDAARRTPHKFGRDKAFIAGVLDKLIERFQPRDPAAFRATSVISCRCSTAWIGCSYPAPTWSPPWIPQLARDSHIQYQNADLHFVNAS